MTADAVSRPTTDDRLLDGRVVLRQPAEGYRAAIDPVLLAASAPVGYGDSVVDLGCGAGAALLCLAARVDAIHVLGIDFDPAALDLARANIDINGLAGRASVACADVTALPDWITPNAHDQVMCNPPFLERGRVTVSAVAGRAVSDVEGCADLATWIDAAHDLVRPKGWLTLIHRADRLDAICARLSGRFGAIEVIPIWPRAGVPARRVVVRARKGVRSPARLSPGLVLHGPDGTYTQTATAILRHAVALDAALDIVGES